MPEHPRVGCRARGLRIAIFSTGGPLKAVRCALPTIVIRWPSGPVPLMHPHGGPSTTHPQRHGPSRALKGIRARFRGPHFHRVHRSPLFRRPLETLESYWCLFGGSRVRDPRVHGLGASPFEAGVLAMAGCQKYVPFLGP